MHKLTVAALVLFLVASAVLWGCSDNDNKEDHVFKSQERALNKANQVQQQLDESTKERKKQVDEMR